MDIKVGKLGLLHIYTGEGKGKTTASIGLALRALGSGFKVSIIQFMKAESAVSGEIAILSNQPDASVERFGGNLLGKKEAPVEEIKKDLSEGLERALEIAGNDSCDLMILDEINVAVSMGLLEVVKVFELVNICKDRSIELVLTGRNALQDFIDVADYVTEMTSVKHPYENGISARRGVEF